MNEGERGKVPAVTKILCGEVEILGKGLDRGDS